MVFKLIQEDGEYTDGISNYTLMSAEQFIDSPEGRNIGCVEFETVELAEKYFNIRKIENENS